MGYFVLLSLGFVIIVLSTGFGESQPGVGHEKDSMQNVYEQFAAIPRHVARARKLSPINTKP